jgi:hypothetical protein
VLLARPLPKMNAPALRKNNPSSASSGTGTKSRGSRPTCIRRGVGPRGGLALVGLFNECRLDPLARALHPCACYRSEDAAVFPAASLARTEKVGNPPVSPV